MQPPTRRKILTAAGILSAGAGGFLAGRRGLLRTARPLFHRLTFRRGSVFTARFAPDGKSIVYDAAWEGGPPRIYTTRAGTPESNLLDIPPARLAAVSRSGELAVILEQSNTLARVPLAGGAPREILHHTLGADWAPDGESLLVVRLVGTKHRIELPAGKVIYQTDNLVTGARLSGDGKQVAFFEKSSSAGEKVSLNIVDLNGNRRKLVAYLVDGLGIAWSPQDSHIWFSGSDGSYVSPVRAVDMQGRMRAIAGMITAAAITDASAGGRALFTSAVSRASMMCKAPGANTERDLAWLDYSLATDISRDGAMVLFSETRQGSAAARQPVSYIRKTDGSAAVTVGLGLSCGLSPDGQWAALLSPGSARQLVVVPTAGGEQRVLNAGSFSYYDARWFPDGRRLLVYGNQDNRVQRHFVQDAAGGPVRAVTSEGAAPEAAIDPDGEYVAAYAGPGLFLYPVDGSQPERVRGDMAGVRPVAWSADGKSLYVRRANTVELVELRTGNSEVWKDLMPADPGGIAFIGRLSMTSDGAAYVYTYERDQSDLYLAEGFE